MVISEKNKNFAGCLSTYFELWYCSDFELPLGEEEYTVILLVLRAVRVSNCPQVSGQGDEGSWGLVSLQFCMMPRWQLRCTRSVCRLNA